MINQKMGLLIVLILSSCSIEICGSAFRYRSGQVSPMPQLTAWGPVEVALTPEASTTIKLVFSHKLIEVSSGMGADQYSNKLSLAQRGIEPSLIESKRFLGQSRELDYAFFRAV